jgi:uncharacterized Tic20 family protein
MALSRDLRPTQDDLNMGMLCHLLAIFTGFLGPLIVWLVKKDRSAFVDFHGKESLNFQITVLLITTALSALGFALIFIAIGLIFFPLIGIVLIGALVLEILACLAASRGEFFRYPLSIRFIR